MNKLGAMRRAGPGGNAGGDKGMTLRELLRVLDEVKRDLDYTRRLEERWVAEEKRFPLIYKHIARQKEFFQEQIDKVMIVDIDDQKVDNYVRARLGTEAPRPATSQVAPAKEAPASEPEALAKTSPIAAEPAPALAQTKKEKPQDEPQGSPREAAPVAPEAPKPVASSVPGKPADGESASREKLRRLASEVLNEVKRAKP